MRLKPVAKERIHALTVGAFVMQSGSASISRADSITFNSYTGNLGSTAHTYTVDGIKIVAAAPNDGNRRMMGLLNTGSEWQAMRRLPDLRHGERSSRLHPTRCAKPAERRLHKFPVQDGLHDRWRGVASDRARYYVGGRSLRSRWVYAHRHNAYHDAGKSERNES